jgi:hypothetical protein
MDERDQNRQLIDARAEGTGRLQAGVEMARGGVDKTRLGVEDAVWFARRKLAWPAADGLERLGPRGTIGVFGGGGIALAGVVAALLIAGSGGSGSDAGTTEAFVVPQAPTAPATAVAPTPKPKKVATKPAGPTLHGAPPDFSPAQNVRAGVGDGRAVDKNKSAKEGKAPVQRGSAAGAGDASAAKIGATPEATASAAAQADNIASGAPAGTVVSGVPGTGKDEGGTELTGPPAPKAAKKVARRFAEAFVVYEVGGVDGKVRKAFAQTGTKQLSRSLLHRPPRQPASVKVPQAKVVNVVAGPSKGSVYTVSVSLLRVGVTSELRLELERGVGKKWQVTNVLG